MIPTSRQVGWWAVPLVLAVVAIGVPTLRPVLLACDLVGLVVLALDAARSGGRFEVERRAPEVCGVGVAVPVVVEIRNLGRTGCSVRVADEQPGEATDLPAVLRLEPGGRRAFAYSLRMERRGRYRFGAVVVRVRSPWGFWERQVRFERPQELRVYPALGRMRAKGLTGREALRRAPVRAQRRAGGENEFRRLRPYVAGDPFRHVDWKATARMRRPISREYGQEINQNVLLLLDAGRMMSAPSGASQMFDHALEAALLLGRLALERGDRVGLLAFDAAVRRWVAPRGGRGTTNRLIRSSFDLYPRMVETDFAGAFRHLALHVKRRSLVVLFTSVIDAPNASSLLQTAAVLGRKHLMVVVWLRDPDVDALLHDGDPFRRAAAAELALERREVLGALARRGVHVVDAALAQTGGAVLAQYLEIKARRLL